MTRARPKIATAPPEPPVVECPYWHAVGNDWLWMIPTAGYCVAGPGGKVRIVADDTFIRCCLPGRLESCEDFGRAAKREERQD